MKILKPSPAELSQMDGFADIIERIRQESELALFADGGASFDVETYQRLHESGNLLVIAVVDQDRVVAFAIALHTTAPRRSGWFYVADVMWAPPDGPAAHLLMVSLIRSTSGSPLFITAPVGGRLHASLNSSPLFRATHAVYATC